MRAQHNVLGKPGYIFTPKGQWSEGPTASMGVVSIPQAHAINHFMLRFANELMYHAAVDVTPFLRVNLNMTYLPQVPRIGIGDRHLDFSLRLLKEREDSWRPDVSLFFTLPQFNSFADYLSHHAIVLTKTRELGSGWKLGGSVGYGLPVYWVGTEGTDKNREPLLPGFARKERINNFYLTGIFGALQWSYENLGGLMLEHDGRGVHAGAFANLWKERISLQVNAYGLRHLGAGLHLNVPLDVKPREFRRFKPQAHD
ncbi:MAG: hypothetical protein ACXIUD_10955 [Mongoliitalea sp.]